jgi:hypothetical protein
MNYFKDATGYYELRKLSGEFQELLDQGKPKKLQR